MSAYTQLPKEHPVMIAWEAFKADVEFENTKRWAMRPEGVVGSLWAAFYAGRQSLEAENDRMRKALEPFAAVGKEMSYSIKPDSHNAWRYNNATVTFGDFREARAALEAKP